MELENLLIHIGYQKTGSTWLQKHLFNNHSIGFAKPFSSPQIYHTLCFPLPLVFNIDQCRKTLVPELKNAEKKGLFPVISREALAGTLRGGGYDSLYLADRILSTFPEAKIFMVIREQRAMIYSNYQQMVKGGYSLTLKELFQLSELKRRRIHLFDLSRFEYHRLIQHYYDLFGKDRVLVLPYELFREDPQKYVKTISSFCQMDCVDELIARLPYQMKVNKTCSGAGTSFQRLINRWFVKDLEFNPTSIFPIPFKWVRLLAYTFDRFLFFPFKNYFNEKYRKAISNKVKDRYQESNKITSKLIGIDLEQYGYDLNDD